MITWALLDARLLCIFPKIRGSSLTLRQDIMCSSVMARTNLVTGFYDPVGKKLVRGRDVVFIEEQTIQDILKTNTPISQCIDGLIDLDPVLLTHVPIKVRDVQDDQHDTGDVDTGSTQVEMGDDTYEN